MKRELKDLDELIDQEFGKQGTPERNKLDEESKAWQAAQLLLQGRKMQRVTQAELARRVGTTKSYISKIETGALQPSIGMYLRLITALGLRFDIATPVGIIG